MNQEIAGKTRIDRRSFLNRAAGLAAGTAVGMTAISYGRILNANDRISLGHIGTGNRGLGLDAIVSNLKDKQNVELIAVCDLWSVNREKAVAANSRYYGRPPQAFQHMEKLLALKEVDAVIIATPEHSHSPVLKAVADAAKHAYVEKPMGNVLEEVKAARDAVQSRKLTSRHAASQRTLPHRRARPRPDRRPGRGEQGGGCLELSRPALARPPAGETDPGGGHGLAPLVDDKTLPAF
jgi:hypothetical protein